MLLKLNLLLMRCRPAGTRMPLGCAPRHMHPLITRPMFSPHAQAHAPRHAFCTWVSGAQVRPGQRPFRFGAPAALCQTRNVATWSTAMAVSENYVCCARDDARLGWAGLGWAGLGWAGLRLF